MIKFAYIAPEEAGFTKYIEVTLDRNTKFQPLSFQVHGEYLIQNSPLFEDFESTLDWLHGYLRSFSAYQRTAKALGHDTVLGHLDQMVHNMKTVLGYDEKVPNKETTIYLRTIFHLYIGRKP